MSEGRARVGEVELAYDTFGDPGDPALVLVMGLGMQMIHWDPELCGLLVDRGFHVVRFDNRDAGLSTKIDGPRPNVLAAMLGMTGSAAYTLDDMARDTAGLLDHLEVEAAHLVGASMGGMIAQAVTASYPERVLSLCSIMSTTGARRVGRPRMKVMGVLLRQAPNEREAFIDHTVAIFKRIGSSGYPQDVEWMRERAGAAYDRCHCPAGTARQLLAILASGDRTRSLRAVRAPTLVIHGAEDPFSPPSGGRATARAIEGAELMIVPGMGHDLPRALWPEIVEAVARNAARAHERPEAERLHLNAGPAAPRR